MVFRLQNNVPDVYVDQSRDFQLFCRLYDSVFNGVKFSIDSIKRATKTTECDSSLLELLQTKLGLFNSSKVDHDELRCLLAVFPTLMRYKGSRKAIDYVLTLYTHLTNSIVGTYNANFLKEHRLVLTFDAPLRNDTILLEILQYILPTGYTVEYEVADIRGINSSMYVQDKYMMLHIQSMLILVKIKVNKYLQHWLQFRIKTQIIPEALLNIQLEQLD